MTHADFSRACSSYIRWMLFVVPLGFLAFSPSTTANAQAPAAQPLLAEQQRRLSDGVQALQTQIDLASNEGLQDTVDSSIFAKGLQWALQYDREFTPADVALMENAVARGTQRLNAIRGQKVSWKIRKGKVPLGYVSGVDGSVQPYGLIVPKSYDPAKSMRLDVVLHGSTRPVGLSELRFMARFDEGDGENSAPPDQPFIELHPLGRVENCYRWAGETDVFEAIGDVCRRYNIDRDRIVLRGMSMGASGTWHLGLKHPDRFVALGPYCGYVDTHKFSETPLGNFVKVGPLPEYQELGLHMLDSIDYAANAGVVPVIACMGEKDIFFDAHVLMGQAMEREGLKLVNLISPGTGHVIDPVTHAEQMRRIAEYCKEGRNESPAELRFVTWTLKYSSCKWLNVLGLKQHYARAEISAKIKDDILHIEEPKNITRFSIDTATLPQDLNGIRIGTKEFTGADQSETGLYMTFEQRDQSWHTIDYLPLDKRPIKRPGMQGPIDDAFTAPFVCVKGTNEPWNPAVQAYADASLQRFAAEWRQYFRGELPIKLDSEITDDDIATKNLILFGDPGSNRLIRKVIRKSPIQWFDDRLNVGEKRYSTDRHVPALIMPNPIYGGEEHYVVINSGHTFREAELAKLNYLLFPRWGDWAILEIDPQFKVGDVAAEKVVQAGYFNEEWALP